MDKYVQITIKPIKNMKTVLCNIIAITILLIPVITYVNNDVHITYYEPAGNVVKYEFHCNNTIFLDVNNKCEQIG